VGVALTQEPHADGAARADPAPPRIAPNAPNAPTDADGTAARLGLEVHGVVAGRLFLPSHAGSHPLAR